MNISDHLPRFAGLDLFCLATLHSASRTRTHLIDPPSYPNALFGSSALQPFNVLLDLCLEVRKGQKVEVLHLSSCDFALVLPDEASGCLVVKQKHTTPSMFDHQNLSGA